MHSDPLAARIAARTASAEARALRLKALVPELARALVERGATRVVLFGSLASGAAPHAGTDIDLCIRGMTLAETERAELELTNAAAPLHLVRWESASPELRAAIENAATSSSEESLSPAEIAEAARRRLASELPAHRTTVGRLTSSIASLTADAGTSVDSTTRCLALAFQIERFYTAVEAVLTRVLRTIDGDVPSGNDWHLELLRASSVEVEDLRPAIVSLEAVPLLRELLGFRHYARHGYDSIPDPARIDALASVVARAQASLETSLTALEASLR